MINKQEKGFAIVLSLVLLMAMTLMGGALIVISAGDHKSNNIRKLSFLIQFFISY